MTNRTRIAFLAGMILVLGLTGLVGRTQAYPEPAPFPITWEFDFTHGRPKPIAVHGTDGKYHWYWYITYKVTNNSGDERLFIPEVSISTDQGDLIPAGKNVPPSVFVAIKAREGKPLLVSPYQVIGKMLQGEDYAKESVIVWPDFGHDIDELRVMIGGLSGETLKSAPGTTPGNGADGSGAPADAAAASETPASSDAAPKPGDAATTSSPATQPTTEPAFRKTLMLTYDLPGTNAPIQETVVIPHGEKWIMR